MEKDWYQKNWTLDIQNMSWVEDTNRQVDFLIKQLHLKGTEKILDLACGFGRHSLEFARRGYDVTGIDITPAYIDYANEQAKKENLNAKFICQDIRTITFDKEFDVVLNMADGALLPFPLPLSGPDVQKESQVSQLPCFLTDTDQMY